MNKINDLVNRLNERMIHPENDTDLLLDELKNIGVEFIDTQDDTFWKYSERQQNHETPEQPDSKALHIADVSNSVCRTFVPDYSTSSATKCKVCGKEKWQH